LNIEVTGSGHWNETTDLLVVGYSKTSGLQGILSEVDAALGGAISDSITSTEITGKRKETFLIHTLGRLKAKRILVVGTGDTPVTTNDLRNIAGIFVREAARVHATNVTIAPFIVADDVSAHDISQAIAEGSILSAYRFAGYALNKTPEHAVNAVRILAEEVSDKHTCGVRCGTAFAAGTMLARDVMNAPGNKMTPTDLANTAIAIATQHDFAYEILERSDMERFGMGALLGVAQGSVEPPKLIVLKYTGNPDASEVIAYVGKGITFDTGGISIKPAEHMDDMKMDMGGGAAVLGAMDAIGRLKPAVNIVAVVAATENMPSGSAFKPGDVLTAMGGKTIEVVNTDAEGRLVLADAVRYAKHLGATHIVDLATLTGAVVVALGNVTTGAMTNSDTFLASFLQAAKRTGEKVWQLPTFEEYKEQIKSDIADVMNLGSGGAGSITAGLFVEAFVDDTPWIHLDIAGTAWTKKDLDFTPKGAAGVMVRTLAQFAKQCAKVPLKTNR